MARVVRERAGDVLKARQALAEAQANLDAARSAHRASEDAEYAAWVLWRGMDDSGAPGDALEGIGQETGGEP